eukprot:gene4970-3555_t
MHSLQASKSRHNIFARVDHDHNYVKAQQSPKKPSSATTTPTESKALVASSSLPSIDFHVRKKLATGDLAAKFSSKTPVVNVSSTLGAGDSQQDFYQSSRSFGDSLFDYNEDEDNQSIRSDSSEPSLRLENFKRNLADSPQHAVDNNADGFFETGFDDDIVEEASLTGTALNNAPDYVSISKQDHKQFQSPLDAHKKFIKAVKSKNHLSSIKTLSSRKMIPSHSQKSLGNGSVNGRFMASSRSTMSGASQNDDSSSVMSEVSGISSATPAPSRLLGGKNSSFLFLSSFKSLAPTIQEEQGDEEEEEEDNATNNGGNNNTFVPFASTDGMDRVGSPSAKAPLESTSTPVVPKVLRMRSFARFSAGGEDNSRLMLRMLDASQKSELSSPSQKVPVVSGKDGSPQSQQKAEKDGASVFSSSSPVNLLPTISNVLSPIISAVAGSPQTSPMPQNDPMKKSLYHVPSLQEVRNKKKNFTDWIDEKIRALTFVPAPPKPETPPPEEVPPMTVESLFGESLIRPGIDKSQARISDAAYQRILSETHEKQRKNIEEQYRLHTLNGNEAEMIKELERDYHYREQQRLNEYQASQRPPLSSSDDINPNEVYTSTYMEPLGLSSRKPPLSADKKKASQQSLANKSTTDVNNVPAHSMSSLAHNPHSSSTGALLPKLDLTSVLQKQQPRPRDMLPRSETFVAASSFDLAAQQPMPFLSSSGDDGSVLSFSSSITSLPGMIPSTSDPAKATQALKDKLATRLPSIHLQSPGKPTTGAASVPKTLFPASPPPSTEAQAPLPTQQERIVYHDPFSTMFAYTSDDINHYSAGLRPDTQAQLQRLYDADPTQSKAAILATSSPSPVKKPTILTATKSIFDLDEDLPQPLETPIDPQAPEPRYTYQHSTTSYVLQDWENFAAKGIPLEAPSFASDPAAIARDDHHRIVQAMTDASNGDDGGVASPERKRLLASKDPSKKRELDALDVLSATKLNRKLTLEDIDTSYQSLRHQSQLLTYSTVAQQELAAQTPDNDTKRIYSILNPGPHEAVIFLPPDHAQFAAEMRETYHSLPAGLLAYTQDKELMESVDRYSKQIHLPSSSSNSPGKGNSPAKEHDMSVFDDADGDGGDQVAASHDDANARRARLQPLLGGSRIISLTQEATEPGVDARPYTLTSHLSEEDLMAHRPLPGQADYAQEFVQTTSYLLSAPGVVYSQPDFHHVRQRLHPAAAPAATSTSAPAAAAAGNASTAQDGRPMTGSAHASLPTIASSYAMSLRTGNDDSKGPQFNVSSPGIKKAPSMVTEYAQYLAQQLEHGGRKSAKPPLYPTYGQSQQSVQTYGTKTLAEQSLNNPSHTRSVAGFNDEFFRAIPVVEESGWDDASVTSKESHRRGGGKAASNNKTAAGHGVGATATANISEEDESEMGSNDDQFDVENNRHNVSIHRHPPASKSQASMSRHQMSASSSSLSMTPSMLDLRADILSFMSKANSHMTHEYASYLDPQLADPQHQQAPLSSSQSVASAAMIMQRSKETAGSGASVASQPSLLPEEHQHLAKLWDQLRNRYAGDKEGAHEMKQKIRQYIHSGIREETQINRSYMEEMEEWK